jgi:hypothetical protein
MATKYCKIPQDDLKPGYICWIELQIPEYAAGRGELPVPVPVQLRSRLRQFQWTPGLAVEVTTLTEPTCFWVPIDKLFQMWDALY